MFDQVWTSTKKTIKKQFNKWVWNAIWRVRLYTNYVLDFKNEQSCSFFFISLRRSWKESSGVQTASFGLLSRQPHLPALSHTVLFPWNVLSLLFTGQKMIYLWRPGSSSIFTSKPLITQDPGRRNPSLSCAGVLPISHLSHNNIRSLVRASHVPGTILSALMLIKTWWGRSYDYPIADENGGTERVSSLPQITQLENGQLRIWTHVLKQLQHIHNYLIMYSSVSLTRL